MPFDKFVDMETLSEERRRALQESLQNMPVAELRKVVKELSEFEGDPWQQKLLEVIETHPEESKQPSAALSTKYDRRSKTGSGNQ